MDNEKRANELFLECLKFVSANILKLPEHCRARFERVKTAYSLGERLHYNDQIYCFSIERLLKEFRGKLISGPLRGKESEEKHAHDPAPAPKPRIPKPPKPVKQYTSLERDRRNYIKNQRLRRRAILLDNSI